MKISISIGSLPLVWLVLLLLLLCNSTDQTQAGGNHHDQHHILGVFPHFGYSHFKVVQPILQALAERGHKLTVISFVKSSFKHANYEELLLGHAASAAQSNATINVCNVDEFKPTRELHVLLNEYLELHTEGQETCAKLYNSTYVTEVLERHQTTPYDLLLTEYFNSDCQLGIAHLLQVPIIAVSSCALMPWYYDRINLPDTPAYVQSEFIGYPAQLNWQQRLVNFLQAKVLKTLYRYRTNAYDNALVKKHLQVQVDVDQVAKAQTAYIFVNQHYSLLGSRSQSQQLIEVGGVHLNETLKTQNLPRQVREFLANATDGVIYISWGSMLRAASIDKTRLSVMLKALKKLPQKIIWKWESSKLPIKSDKFLFIKWAPQLAVLCHPSVRLFWSHGGLLGTMESVHCGKPLLVTPIYGDQFLNAHAVVNRGIGLKLDYNHFSDAQLPSALKEALKPRFARRALLLSKVFNDRVRTPLETAVWAVEQQLNHGRIAGELLRTPAVQLNWFVYYSLDSMALLLAALVALLWILKYVCASVWRICSAKNKPAKAKKSKQS